VFVANPLHYLALIEMKPGALDQAAALQGWALPEVFHCLQDVTQAWQPTHTFRSMTSASCLARVSPGSARTVGGGGGGWLRPLAGASATKLDCSKSLSQRIMIFYVLQSR
jgi:hypothetical protein